MEAEEAAAPSVMGHQHGRKGPCQRLWPQKRRWLPNVNTHQAEAKRAENENEAGGTADLFHSRVSPMPVIILLNLIVLIVLIVRRRRILQYPVNFSGHFSLGWL